MNVLRNNYVRCAAVLLCTPFLLCSCEKKEQEPVAIEKEWPAFQASNAWDDVQNLVGFGLRSYGEPGHRFALHYLTTRLRAHGLVPSVITFTNQTAGRSFIFHNVEAILPGNNTNIVILSAHYDARGDVGPAYQSANSTASGPATLLEMARVLTARENPSGPEIRFVLFDGFEPMVQFGHSDGLQGSRHYLRRLADQGKIKNIQAMINLDMVGDQYLTITLPRNLSKPLREKLLAAAHTENARRYFKLVPIEIGDNHDPFHERGIPSITLIDFEFGSTPGRNDYWRTENDRIEHLSPASLDVVGRVTLRLVRDIITPE